MRPVIFSGTTEGRTLSEALSGRRIRHIVCVATEYGRLVMQGNEYADIREGRLDADAMKELIEREGSIVFDATHPYAEAVSDNIRKACASAGAEYVRIYRPETAGTGSDRITYFDNTADCAGALRQTSGNILLTTGSKDLRVFAEDPDVRERLYVRVLPSEESIRLCNDAGISGRHIIAMQGPFSTELNSAVFRQYGIRTIVTKSSGRPGGLPEKLEAAACSDVSVYIIGRPQKESGLTVQEACSRYFDIREDSKKFLHVDLVGIGPGDRKMLTARASEAIGSAELLFGARRMTAPYEGLRTYPVYRAEDIIPVLQEHSPARIAVLFSGDTGFYSGSAKMRRGLSAWLDQNDYVYEIETIPGISSFAYLAARTGTDYTNAGLVSIHGRSEDPAAEADLIRSVRSHHDTFVLLSGGKDVRRLGCILNDNRLSHTMVILGCRLSYPDEEITELSPDECLSVPESGLYIALVVNPRPEDRPLVPVLSDDSFIRGKVPMTKESVRHLSILKLGLRKGSVLYDIGSGTGSVACEAASLDESVEVYAIEMKPEACRLTQENAAALGLSNVRVIEGRAPEIMRGLKAPTHAFIGGSSGDLRAIIDALPSGTRVVINAVSLETMSEIVDILNETDVTDLSVEQISVSRSRELGSYHLMSADNPVMTAAFTLAPSRDMQESRI